MMKIMILTAAAALMLAAGNAHAGLDDTYAEDCAQYGGEGTVDQASGTISWHVSNYSVVEAFVNDKCAMCTEVADPGSYSKADVKDFVARNGGASGVWNAYDAGPRYLKAWVNSDDTQYAGLAVDGSAIRVCYKWWLESRGLHHPEATGIDAASKADLNKAEHKLQSVWNHLSASQRRALKAEEIDWITVKDAAITDDIKVQMINERIAELEAKYVRPSNAERPSSAEASVAMNRLQDALGKPRVTSGVWYDRDEDTYNWFGPKFHHVMSEPASQFLTEVGPYLLHVLPIESPLDPPPIGKIGAGSEPTGVLPAT
jgi:hypothetical protein